MTRLAEVRIAGVWRRSADPRCCVVDRREMLAQMVVQSRFVGLSDGCPFDRRKINPFDAVHAAIFGFGWRDDEPSGLLSQLWYLDATRVDDPDQANASRSRLLAYNEDDVRATRAIREGMATAQWP
jgi:RNase H-like protein